jgi:hypothetical protein
VSRNDSGANVQEERAEPGALPALPSSRVDGSESTSLTRAEILAAVNDVVAEQRVAILARDAAEMNRLCEILSQLLISLPDSVRATVDGFPLRGNEAAEGTAILARQIRDRLRTNRVLIGSGTVIADHFLACVGAALPAAVPVLLSEVA